MAASDLTPLIGAMAHAEITPLAAPVSATEKLPQPPSNDQTPISSTARPGAVFPVAAGSENDDFIMLTVGGPTRFYANVNTLVEGSGFFKGRLSSRWSVMKTEGIRHMFVDADPEVFPFMLDIIRTGKMPLLWDEDTRKYDVKMYSRILAQAQLLLMPDAANWIERNRYKHVVTIKRRARIETNPWNSDSPHGRQGNDILDTNGTINAVVNVKWIKEAHYPCPSGLHAERFRSYPCEQITCVKARGKREPRWIEITRPKVTVVREKVFYNFHALNPTWKPAPNAEQPGENYEWTRDHNEVADVSDDEESDEEEEDL